MVRIHGTQSIPFSSGGMVLARYENRNEELGPIARALVTVFGPVMPATLKDASLIPSFDAAPDTFTRSNKSKKGKQEVDVLDIFVPSNK